MKLIKPKFEITEQASGIFGILKHIERCGRVCYKSEDKITPYSSRKFVERLKESQHLSVLEHGTVYLYFHVTDPSEVGEDEYHGQQTIMDELVKRYSCNKFSVVKTTHYYDTAFITTNYRVIIENGWESDLQYECEPTEFHEKRVTVRFTTDIGISREFNRHRVNSISEQSTRYCNYSKDKFGNEISVVPPTKARSNAEKALESGIDFFSNENNFFSNMCGVVMEITRDAESEDSFIAFTDIDTWLFANLSVQWAYMRLTSVFGWSAQEARSILPLDTQTEFYHTAFVKDWENFFKLRCDSHAHPMARELAIPLREEFVKRGLIKEK